MQRYAITDGAPRSQIEAWAHAGVEWIQIREPGLPPEALALRCEELAAICRDASGSTHLLVNGLEAAEAMLAGAEGTHLRGGAIATQVQTIRASGALVSVSCHTLANVQQACRGGADALLWAPVYGKTIDGRIVTPGSGLAALAAACRETGETPVFALGGITLENAEACVQAGAVGVAGIRLFAGEQWRALR